MIWDVINIIKNETYLEFVFSSLFDKKILTDLLIYLGSIKYIICFQLYISKKTGNSKYTWTYPKCSFLTDDSKIQHM